MTHLLIFLVTTCCTQLDGSTCNTLFGVNKDGNLESEYNVSSVSSILIECIDIATVKHSHENLNDKTDSGLELESSTTNNPHIDKRISSSDYQKIVPKELVDSTVLTGNRINIFLIYIILSEHHLGLN